MSRRRLFYVLDSLEADEVGNQVAALLGRIARSRFEPRVVALGGKDDLWERFREMKVSVYRLNLSGTWGTIRSVSRLRRVLNRLGCEVAHTFQPWSGAAAQLAVRDGVPVFHTVRSLPPDGRSLRFRFLNVMARRARRRGNRRLLATTPGAARFVESHFAEPAEVVPDCVDVVGVREAVESVPRGQVRIQWGIRDHETVFACTEAFGDRTRIDEILRAFATARTERPGMRLFLVGSGPHDGLGRWLAEELHLGDAVVFLGANPGMNSVLRACDAVIDASPWPGWTAPVLSAVAVGCPVIKRIALEDSDPGSAPFITVVAGHPERLAVEMVRMASDHGYRRRLHEEARAAARDIDVSAVAERLERLYGAALA